MSESYYFKKALLQGQQSGADSLNQFAAGQEKQQQDAASQKLKDFLQGGAQKRALDLASQKMEEQGDMHPGMSYSAAVTPEGASLSSAEKYGPHIAAQDPANQSRHLREMARKDLGSYSGEASTLSLMHEFLDNPNAINQKKLQVLNARLTEGQGQRLLDSVIQSMGGDQATLAGNAANKANWLFNTAKGTMQPAQIKATRENLFQYGDQLGTDFGTASDRFKKYAPDIAGNVPNRDALVDSELKPTQDYMSSLNARRDAFRKPPMVLAPGTPGGPPQGLGQLGIGRQTPPRTLQNAPGAPSAPAGGGSPQPGGKMRVKHRQSGQTGTIDPAEFDPSLYEQVQ